MPQSWAAEREPDAPSEPGRPGRPRRYETAEEQTLLLDAAFEVIRAKGYGAATVADILGEAGLSTRSFYRHYASKDDLLHALFRRDAERFAEVVRARVQAETDPVRALDVWIDEILGFGFERTRTKRAAVIGSATAEGTLPPEELRRALQLLVEPLATVLATGRADGSFPAADPERDAALVSTVVWETSGRMREASSRAAKAELREGVVSFVHRALGTRR
ncbi:MAG TPA: TetR/AcrR family transcriptional regulator [Acidimicrobiales bacterium]|nr:TetR/AcrR family transcriptional regulator [Acidimicrobiales bacterium]